LWKSIYSYVYYSRWWKNLNVEANFYFVRNRIVEMYFWMNGACHEPQYSHSRIILAKMTGFITILDDFIDTYATTEESMQLAEAVFRSDWPSPTQIFCLFIYFIIKYISCCTIIWFNRMQISPFAHV